VIVARFAEAYGIPTILATISWPSPLELFEIAVSASWLLRSR
jgi:hypothetical protein